MLLFICADVRVIQLVCCAGDACTQVEHVLSSRLQASAALHRPYVAAGMRLLSACWAPEVVAAHPAALSVRLSSGLVHLVSHVPPCVDAV